MLGLTTAVSQNKSLDQPRIPNKKEIRKFNFLNATYEANCAGEGFRAKVRNGLAGGGSYGMRVLVSYGDLNGDGIEEAAVVVQCDGAVQSMTEGTIYTVRNHRLARLAKLELGTRNHNYLLNAKIKKGFLGVTRGADMDKFENQCPENNLTYYKLSGKRLKQIGKIICTRF